MRNGMKAPAQLPGAHIEGAHIARRRRMRLRIAPAHNNQVLVDHPRRGQRNRLLLKIPAQFLAQIHAPALAKLPQSACPSRASRQ